MTHHYLANVFFFLQILFRPLLFIGILFLFPSCFAQTLYNSRALSMHIMQTWFGEQSDIEVAWKVLGSAV